MAIAKTINMLIDGIDVPMQIFSPDERWKAIKQADHFGIAFWEPFVDWAQEQAEVCRNVGRVAVPRGAEERCHEIPVSMTIPIDRSTKGI